MPEGEWRYWGGDAGSTRYSPLDRIDADNFGDLQVVWRWFGANYGPAPDYVNRATPIYADGRLFILGGDDDGDEATSECAWRRAGHSMEPSVR
jgi:quinoprotein glucose dehydrogenase